MSLKITFSLSAFALLLSLGLLNAQSATAANPSFPLVTTVLTPQNAQTLYELIFEQAHIFKTKPGKQNWRLSFWSPTRAEISEAENNLASYVWASNDAYNQSIAQIDLKPYGISLTTDLRQFAGVMQGSTKIILINGCTSSFQVPVFATATGEQAIDYDWPMPHGRIYGDDALFFVSYKDDGAAFRAAYNLGTHRIIYLNFDHLVQQTQPQFRLQN